MTISLENDIRAALARQADRTTIDPDARIGSPVIRPDGSARQPHPGRTILAVAATVVVAVAGLVVLDRARADDPAPPTDLPRADLPTVDPRSAAIGLYPAGDLAAVVAAGYSTPQAAVAAYLADRTRTEVLPDGYTVTAAVSEVEPVRVDDSAIVGFSLQTVDDGGDGLLLARQVAQASSPERWVVVAGGIASVAIAELDYRDGRLSGSIATDEAGGRNVIDVYDAVTGERLASTTDDPFTFEGLSAPAVSVRLWRTEGDGGFPRANFAEALVHDGETVTDVGAAALSDQYSSAVQQRMDQPIEPFDTGPISAFLTRGAGDLVTVVDDPDLTIEARVRLVARTGQEEYCLAVRWAGRDFDVDSEALCFSPEVVAGQYNPGNGAGMGEAVGVVDAMDGTQVLVVGAVPDAVTEIRTETGKSIAPAANIWWDVIDAGTLMTYTVVADDGRTIELTAG